RHVRQQVCRLRLRLQQQRRRDYAADRNRGAGHTPDRHVPDGLQRSGPKSLVLGTGTDIRARFSGTQYWVPNPGVSPSPQYHLVMPRSISQEESRMQIRSGLSIVGRATGVVLLFGALGALPVSAAPAAEELAQPAPPPANQAPPQTLVGVLP